MSLREESRCERSPRYYERTYYYSGQIEKVGMRPSALSILMQKASGNAVMEQRRQLASSDKRGWLDVDLNLPLALRKKLALTLRTFRFRVE